MGQGIWPIAIGAALLIGFLILIGVAIHVGIVIWCYMVGKRKGQELVGLLLGIFLGWIGLIIIYVLPDQSKPSLPATPYGSGQTVKCPHCSRQVPAEARFCPYCGNMLE
jgi:hypothetical protein